MSPSQRGGRFETRHDDREGTAGDLPERRSAVYLCHECLGHALDIHPASGTRCGGETHSSGRSRGVFPVRSRQARHGRAGHLKLSWCLLARRARRARSSGHGCGDEGPQRHLAARASPQCRGALGSSDAALDDPSEQHLDAEFYRRRGCCCRYKAPPLQRTADSGTSIAVTRSRREMGRPQGRILWAPILSRVQKSSPVLWSGRARKDDHPRSELEVSRNLIISMFFFRSAAPEARRGPSASQRTPLGCRRAEATVHVPRT